MRRWAAIVMTGWLGGLLGCQPQSATAPATQTATAGEITLMTFNVNYGIAGDPETIAAIAREDADVVMLQETNEAWEAALRSALSDSYPHMAFHHEGGAGGLAILSRYPFDTGEVLPATEGWFPAWRVVLHTPAGDIQAMNVHLRPQISDSGSVVSGYFTTPAVREAEMADFYGALVVEPALPTVVAGDFNESASGGALDYLAERGFENALPRHAGSAPTWRWQTSVGAISMQLDHVMVAGAEPVAARVVETGNSDHLPVVTRLALPARTPE